MMICVILYMHCPALQILCNPAFVLQYKQNRYYYYYYYYYTGPIVQQELQLSLSTDACARHIPNIAYLSEGDPLELSGSYLIREN